MSNLGRQPTSKTRPNMSSIENLRYPLGFLVGADNANVAAHFRPIDFPLPLAVHPKTQIAVVHNLVESLAVLGEAVHPELPHLDLQGIANHLSGNSRTRQEEIDKLVGRFALIQGGRGGDLRIQTDAIAMRTVFFSLSDHGVIAGSHAKLVVEARPGGKTRNKFRFRWGYPGLNTPYASVYRLPPNCELSLVRGSLHRFFPGSAIPETDIEEAWNIAFNRASATIRALADRRKLLLSLSAGLDTRTTLAASRDSWSQLTFFTYNGGVPKDRVDADVAAALAKTLRLRHVFVDYSGPASNKAVSRILSENSFASHKPKVACAYHRLFGEHAFLHIRSNLLELGRSNLFYKFAKRRGMSGPCTAQSMGDIYTLAAKLDTSKSAHVIPAFEHYIAATDYADTVGKVSPWDMYFVEHRMGAWHAGVLLESDVSFDTVIAFNSREVIRHFMGVPQEARCSSPHLRERLNALLPEVMDIPINPGRYIKVAVE